MNKTWMVYGTLFLMFEKAVAQLRIEQVPLSPVKSNTGFFVYGAGSLNTSIPYSSINGTAFWSTEFIPATIYAADGEAYGTCPVKLNLATSEINFLNARKEELTAQPGIIRKIIFHDIDNAASVLTVFRNDIDEIYARSIHKGSYVQELNQGDIQLLKVSKKILVESDSLFGTKKKYTFGLQEFYFIKERNRIYPLKKLNRKEVLPVLHVKKEQAAWLDKNTINLSREKEVIRLLEFLNTKNN